MNLLQSTERFPTSPGVYLMKDARGHVLYIGKAVNLKSRVRSYFTATHEDRPHILPMMARLASIEWIATETNSEAFILEANLIRSHKPPFNVMLRDDKHYPYLKVTLDEHFPRLIVVRRVHDDGAKYFGPFTDATAMRRLMNYAKRIFRIRDCNKKLPLARPVRPCINYQIGRCSAPCAGLVDEHTYRENVEQLIRFLQGRRSDLVTDLNERMQEASGRMAFEQAASLRDQIRLIEDASSSQKVDLKMAGENVDLFGIHLGERHTSLAVLQFREGLLMSTRNFVVQRATWELSEANHDAMVVQYYQNSTGDLPADILLSDSAGFDPDTLRDWFANRYERSITVAVPQRGTRRHLVALAEKNAELYLAQKAPVDQSLAIEELQEVLHLPVAPRTIEAFDISNLGETFAVAGMVHFENGAPRKSQYRRFKMATVSGQNDFSMLMEAVTRRLSRLLAEDKPFPDLLLIDGGKGQLSSVVTALGQFEHPPQVASLAKKEELLYSPFVDGDVRLPQTHPARRLVERIRDEVHRYAITYHRKIRGTQFKRSGLEEIPGVGPKTARALLRRFGSMRRLREAPVEEITEVRGVTRAVAERIHDIVGDSGQRT